MTPSISVIVPSRDTREMTLACLAAVERSAGAGPIEILVVDDGGVDDTPAAVAAAYPAVRILRRTAPGGFAAAANDGLRAARGEILVLVNSDAEPEPDALARLSAAFESDARLGAAGAALVDPDGAPQWSAGRRPTLLWLFGLASGLPRALARFRAWRRWKPPGAPAERAEWVSGAAMAIRRAAWREAGGLDERFAFYCQDLEYCERLRRAGWKIRLVADARVRHRGGATIGARGVPLLWADLVRWSALEGGRRSALRAAHAFAAGGRLRLAARSLAAPWIPRARRDAWRTESAVYREALSAVRACVP